MDPKWSYFAIYLYMSRYIGKPTICIGENKDADQLHGNREADQRLCFHYLDIVQFLFYLNPKFQASSSFLCLYCPVCVRPVRKPHCWVSHEAAHILLSCYNTDWIANTDIVMDPNNSVIKRLRCIIVKNRRYRDCYSQNPNQDTRQYRKYSM